MNIKIDEPDPIAPQTPGIQSSSTEWAYKIGDTDTLTGVLNRNGLFRELNEIAHNIPGKFGVLAIDLDELKPVNDIAGHAAGDELLQNFATILTHELRTAPEQVTEEKRKSTEKRPDLIAGIPARIGGDEFIVILPGADTHEKVDTVKSRLQENLSNAGIEASMGGKPHEGAETIQQLLDKSDRLMMRNKRERKQEKIRSLPLRKRVARRLGKYLVRYSGVNGIDRD